MYSSSGNVYFNFLQQKTIPSPYIFFKRLTYSLVFKIQFCNNL